MCESGSVTLKAFNQHFHVRSQQPIHLRFKITNSDTKEQPFEVLKGWIRGLVMKQLPIEIVGQWKIDVKNRPRQILARNILQKCRLVAREKIIGKVPLELVGK